MRSLAFVFLLFTLNACSSKPAKIEYGKDACHFCKMSIVDKTHAAQIVTKKGRNFKYDAIECMLNDLESKDQEKMKLILVTNYTIPKDLISVTDATFLISEAIQSPMGANLTGFKTKDDASRVIKENGNGQLYDWLSIQQLFYN